MTNQQSSGADGAEPSESEPGTGSPTKGEPMLQPPVAAPLVATPTGELIEEERAIDEQLMRRIENLPREAGWALITAGVIGVIAPGVLGWPFVVAGAFVLAPGGPRRLALWAGRKPRKHAHAALRQICRLVDDLERRYPSVRTDAPPVVIQHRSYIDVQ
jgi:hypothetical protein